MKTAEELNLVSKDIVDSIYQVHKEMGPGLLESIYETCLTEELLIRKYLVETQVNIPLFYKGKKLHKEYYLDMLVEREIIIEIKSVENMLPVFKAQLLSYLKITGYRLGFLVNFNVPYIKNGITRLVNNFY